MSSSTTIPSYHCTPTAIMAALKLFHQHNIIYLLFKCEHIFAGQNKNLDILFETDADYHQASALLEKNGFVLRFGEEVEKYKKMYCKYEQSIMTSIHLHHEIAWHGMIALDKKEVFRRKRKINPLIIIPSIEDSILIHAAHVLFENFKVTEREKEYFQQLPTVPIDKKYIQKQLRLHKWEKGFWKVIQALTSLPKKRVIVEWGRKILREPSTLFYLLWKGVRIPLRKVDFRRKGCLVTLVGVNGSGKTTLSKELVQAYAPCTNHLGIGSQYYYFGWEPTFIVTKVISAFLKKIKVSLFHHQVLKRELKPTVLGKDTTIKLLQELSFMYQFFEFMYRYLTRIRPSLQQGGIVISDRYFYDLFGQYPLARHSWVLPKLMKLFPRPNFIFWLRCDQHHLTRRDKFNREENKSHPRKILPLEYLQQQIDNYALLKNQVPLQEINSMDTLQNNTGKILDLSWKAVVKGS